MTEIVTLQSVEVDWLTLSSYDPYIAEWGYQFIKDYEHEESRWLQYSGFVWSPRTGGNLFSGSGKQGRRTHYVLRLSGNVARDLWPKVADMIDGETVKCTRIDLQVTVEQPEGWDQWAIAQKISEKRSKPPSFIGSVDKESGRYLATIGIGSRQSEEYIRMYQKVTADGRPLLRFEGEYKGPKARGVVEAVRKDPGAAAAGLRYRVESLKVPEVSSAFSCLNLALPAKFERVKGAIDRRESWLIGSVIPSLQRYLNETNNERVLWAFQEVIDDYLASDAGLHLGEEWDRISFDS